MRDTDRCRGLRVFELVARADLLTLTGSDGNLIGRARSARWSDPTLPRPSAFVATEVSVSRISIQQFAGSVGV